MMILLFLQWSNFHDPESYSPEASDQTEKFTPLSISMTPFKAKAVCVGGEDFGNLNIIYIHSIKEGIFSTSCLLLNLFSLFMLLSMRQLFWFVNNNWLINL